MQVELIKQEIITIQHHNEYDDVHILFSIIQEFDNFTQQFTKKKKILTETNFTKKYYVQFYSFTDIPQTRANNLLQRKYKILF